MVVAVNAETRVSYIKEVTPGTTPANPAFQILRCTGESLKIERNVQFSSELDGRRGQKNFARGIGQGSGSIDFEFTDGTLDDILESALRATWATDVLTDANETKSFTLDVKFEQGGTDTYKRLTGAEVQTFSLDIRAGEIVTGAAGFVARDGTFSSTVPAGATFVAPNSEPLETGSTVDTLTLAGMTLGIVPSVTLALNNNTTPRFGVGDDGTREFGAGQLEITVTIAALLSESQLGILQGYAAGTSTGLTMVIGSTANKKYRIELPNCIIEDVEVASTSKEGDVIANINLRALQSSTISQSVVRVTRHVA